MEVVCGRCKADYEFDNTLISARGTTVRCTNCGLQFKVFPPGGVGAPEEWSVLGEDGKVICSYATLADLQRAIGFGELTGDDLLVRGDDAPRRMADILELAPLLRQGASYRPPAVSERPPAVSPHGARADLRPGQSSLAKTRIGSPFAPDVEHRGTPAPVAAFDPADTPLGAPVLNDRSRRAVETPRIRSALSGPFLGVRAAPESPPGTLPSGSPSAGASRSHLPSLSATLVSPPGGLERPEPISPREPASGERAAESQAGGQVTGLEPPPSSGAQRSSAKNGGLGKTQPSITPEMVRTPRNSTPLPGHRDSDPRSVARSERRGPGEPRRMARAAVFAIVIFGGALVFALTVGRSKVRGLFSAESKQVGAALNVESGAGTDVPSATAARADAPEGVSPAAEGAADAPALSPDELMEQVELLDLDWLRVELEPGASTEVLAESLAPRAEARLVGLLGSDPLSKVAQIHLLRIAGKVALAREVVATLGATAADYPYAIAMLDLAEDNTSLSPAMLSAELARARAGRAPFLPESARILALVRSHELDRARAELEALRQTAGVRPVPLEKELAAAIERRTAEPAPLPASPPASEAPAQSPGARLAAPSEKPTKGERNVAKAAPDEVQAWAAEADALWSSGDQARAVVLYTKVRQALGGQHFLGQRAAARIKQASREEANP